MRETQVNSLSVASHIPMCCSYVVECKHQIDSMDVVVGLNVHFSDAPSSVLLKWLGTLLYPAHVSSLEVAYRRCSHGRKQEQSASCM